MSTEKKPVSTKTQQDRLARVKKVAWGDHVLNGVEDRTTARVETTPQKP
jgi:hypothetical protein